MHRRFSQTANYFASSILLCDSRQKTRATKPIPSLFFRFRCSLRATRRIRHDLCLTSKINLKSCINSSWEYLAVFIYVFFYPSFGIQKNFITSRYEATGMVSVETEARWLEINLNSKVSRVSIERCFDSTFQTQVIERESKGCETISKQWRQVKS